MQVITSGDAKIPIIGLGTWPMLGRWCTETVAEAEAEAEALALGYRHIDTAQMTAMKPRSGLSCAPPAFHQMRSS